MFTLFGVREHRATGKTGEEREKFSFKQIFHTIARNDQLVWVSVIFLIQQVGNGLVIGGIGSAYIYFTFGYNGGLIWRAYLNSFIIAIVQTLGTLFTSSLAAFAFAK